MRIIINTPRPDDDALRPSCVRVAVIKATNACTKTCVHACVSFVRVRARARVIYANQFTAPGVYKFRCVRALRACVRVGWYKNVQHFKQLKLA